MNRKLLYRCGLLALVGLSTCGQLARAQGVTASGASPNSGIPPETFQALFRVPMYPVTPHSAFTRPLYVSPAGYGASITPATPATSPASEPTLATPVVEADTVLEPPPTAPVMTNLKAYRIEQTAPAKELPAKELIDKSGEVTKDPLAGNPPPDDLLLDGYCGPYCHGGWSWVCGLEQTFLVPNTQGLGADVTVVSPTNVFNTSGDESMEFGPRVWYGLQYCNWQIRNRFWTINGVEDTIDPLIVGGADRLGVIDCSYVDALTVDVEVLRMFCCAEDWNLYAGVGFRYGSLRDVANLQVTQLDNQAIPAVVQANSLALFDMDGTGVTIPVGGFKPIHCFCCSTLDAFCNLRGSILFGDIENVAQTSVTVLDPTATATANRFDAASARTSDEMTIFELQAGLRWRHQLQCHPACAALWIAFEYQWWNADGGIAFTESAAQVNNNGGLARASTGPDLELSLVGFTLGASLNW